MKKTVFPCLNTKLARFINDFTLLDFSDFPEPDEPLSVPPLGFPVIQFHFGKKANFYNIKEFPDESIIIGQITHHIKLKPVTGTRLVGINFKPYGLFNMFGIEPESFTNSAIISKALFGVNHVNDLINLLKKTDSNEATFDILQAFLLQMLNVFEGNVASCFDNVVDAMIKDQGMSKLEDYLNKNMNIRSLQRYFKQVIGISPKLFTQILRHKYILHKFYENPDLKWSDAAFNGFYYDYSHFSRDFVKFTNQKPIEYLHIKNTFAEGMV